APPPNGAGKYGRPGKTPGGTAMKNRKKTKNHRPPGEDRRGAVLLVVLVTVVMLSLAAYQYSTWMSSEYKVSRTSLRAAQANALAQSGVHYAASLLSSPDALSSTLNGNPYNNPLFRA